MSSNDGAELVALSTTTPIGLNQRTLFSVSISSSSVNIAPKAPKIATVTKIKTKTVNVLRISFLVVDKNASALDQIDLTLLI